MPEGPEILYTSLYLKKFLKNSKDISFPMPLLLPVTIAVLFFKEANLSILDFESTRFCIVIKLLNSIY